MSIVSRLAELLAQARDEQAKVEGKLQTLLQRREDLLSLPLPKKDFADTVVGWIELTGNEYPERLLQHRLSGLVEQPLRDVPTFGFNPLTLDANNVPNPGALLYLFKDEILRGVRRAIEAMPWPEVTGPPRAERIKELARLDAEIGQLQAELEQLRQAAAGS